MKKKITIKDIAEECGISIGTVDRVIHQRGRFSKETGEKVRAAIERLEYTPMHTPANTSWKIGVNYPVDSSPLSFWKDAGCGIQQAAANIKNRGIEIVEDCSSSYDPQQQIQSIHNLLEQKVDAIITTAFDSDMRTQTYYRDLIPEETPFATVVNKSWNNRCLFHIGPNDEAMGELMAKLISLYCPKAPQIALVAPNIEIEGTHNRIKGFINKVQKELHELNVLQIAPVITKTVSDSYTQIGKETKKLLDMYEKLDALYVTNGYVQPVCDAIQESGRNEVQVFGHEVFENMKSYLDDGRLTATIYQNPKQQWYDAVMAMASHLADGQRPPELISADCHIITRESYPLVALN